MDMVTQVMDKINDVFNDDYLNSLADETGFIRRKRKIMPRKFLENIVMATLAHPQSSLEDLAADFENEKESVTKQALHKKFNSNTLEFIQAVLESLLKEVLTTDKFSLKAMPCVNRLIVGDSSKVSLKQSLHTEFPGLRNQGAALKIQSIMSLLDNQIKSLEITPATEPDQSYRKHWRFIQENDLWIGDLGYFALETFQHIIEKKAYFLSRYFRRTRLFKTSDSHALELRTLLKEASEDVVTIEVILGTKDIRCHCVAIRLNEKDYWQRVKRLQEKRRKDKRMKTEEEDNVLDRWSILVTNLPLPEDKNILWNLYILRWQIELLFKTMKSFLNLRKIEQGNRFRSMVSVYSSLIAVVLLTLITMTITHQEISLYKACRIFTKHIHLFFEYLRDQKKMAVSWFREKISRFAGKESRLNRPSTRQALGWGFNNA